MITPRCAPAVLVCVENRRWRPDDKKGSVLPYLYDALTHLSTGATISNKMTESGNLLLGPRVKSSRTGMEPRDVSYNSKDFIKTGTNLISRKAVIKNPQRVEMRGRVSTWSIFASPGSLRVPPNVASGVCGSAVYRGG